MPLPENICLHKCRYVHANGTHCDGTKARVGEVAESDRVTFCTVFCLKCGMNDSVMDKPENICDSFNKDIVNYSRI